MKRATGKSATKRGARNVAERNVAERTVAKLVGVDGKGSTRTRGHASGMTKPHQGAADLPEFCDFDCPHASFSPPDASGACRRDQAVWCVLVGRYNNKNARCLGHPRKHL